MIPSPSRLKRNLVPRWRSLSKSIASGELSSVQNINVTNKVLALPLEFRERLEKWRKDPNIITAAELVESAIINGHEDIAVNAARLLVQETSKATLLVRKHAAIVLKNTGHGDDAPPSILAGPQDTVKIWRARTRLNPQNSLAWVELALAQVSRGHAPNALKSMRIALQLAPHNRHVLRSAARLYLHMHEAERAHELIRKNEATLSDPWLMAAEIALAPIAERRPMFLKRGLELVEKKNHLPFQITELSGAIGSNLLAEGNRKKGKRLFEQSMLAPTGNVLAQAEWASEKYNEILFGEAQLMQATDAKEAKAFHFYRYGDFKHSFDCAIQWVEEEQFSSSAYVMSTAVANVLGNYQKADELAREGLQRDHHSVSLLNAQAFALACLGNFEGAIEILKRISTEDPINLLVKEANFGLIAMRQGQSGEGIAHYRNTIAGFHRQNNIAMECLAYAYFAREAIQAQLPEAKQILAEAEERNVKPVSPAANYILKKTRDMLKGMVS